MSQPKLRTDTEKEAIYRDARPEQLAEAVRVVAAVEALLAPSITRGPIEEFVHRPAPGHTMP